MAKEFWTREKHYNQKYGITVREYDIMAEEQDYCYKICGNPEEGTRRLAEDHDHDTGEVRGLLCRACNLMLGNAYDDASILLKGAEYLTGLPTGFIIEEEGE